MGDKQQGGSPEPAISCRQLRDDMYGNSIKVTLPVRATSWFALYQGLAMLYIRHQAMTRPISMPASKEDNSFTSGSATQYFELSSSD